MRIGIVCEGVHDYPALKVLAEELAQGKGLGPVVCFPLQPAPDASSRSGDGGWAKVVAWCKVNSGRGLDTYLRAPLFEGEEVYDLILVHLDGDIAAECAAKFGRTIDVNPSVEERVVFLSELLLEFCDAPSEFRERIRTAIPTMKTESWMLAGLSLGEHDWENVEAKSLLLAESGFAEGRPGKAAHYQGLAERLRVRLGEIRARCLSFRMFEESVFP
jgi:hypothetical protein